jgi:hypothetical protein
VPTGEPGPQTDDATRADLQPDRALPGLGTLNPAAGEAGVTSFLWAEAATGLIVGLGCIVVAVPWTVTRLSDASVLLLMPIVVLVSYGLLVLRRPPRSTVASAGPSNGLRRVVRRRVLGWGLITLSTVAVPTDWVWPLFVGGWATLLYAIWQVLSLRRNR